VNYLNISARAWLNYLNADNLKRLPQQELDLAIEAATVRSCPLQQ
jgi:hypothetical protein